MGLLVVSRSLSSRDPKAGSCDMGHSSVAMQFDVQRLCHFGTARIWQLCCVRHDLAGMLFHVMRSVFWVSTDCRECSSGRHGYELVLFIHMVICGPCSFSHNATCKGATTLGEQQCHHECRDRKSSSGCCAGHAGGCIRQVISLFQIKHLSHRQSLAITVQKAVI